MSASPSLAGASGVPHSGHVVGMTNSRSDPSRKSTTGPSTSGITSPALRITTVSPINTPLRFTSAALCRVASPTVDPATVTGVMNANGVPLPGRVLVCDRPARCPRGGTQPALQRHIVDFDDDAVDFVSHVMTVLAPVGNALQGPGSVLHPRGVFGDGEAP